MRRAALGALALVVAGCGSSSEGDDPSRTISTKLAEIERRDLVESQAEDGTLGFSDSRTTINRLSGTVTWLPKVGAVVRTNRRLYEVDGKPVYLLDGATPAYRALGPSTSDGDDVRTLERNLRALGYDPAGAITIDGDWDSATTAAVKRWQDDKGFKQTGTIELGRVVFAPGTRRIAKLNVTLGGAAGSGQADSDGGGVAGVIGGFVSAAARALQVAAPTTTSTTPTTTSTTPTTTTPTTTTPTTATPPAQPTPPRSKPSAPAGSGTPTGSGSPKGGDDGSDDGGGTASELMTTTSTRQLVTVDLDASKQSIAKRGARVGVELPSGEAAGGRIVSVGKVATTSSGGEGEGQGDGTATLEVTVKLFKRVKALDQAPVTVNFEQSRAKDVLTVPVTALLARPGGTFAVELREGSERRLVTVTTGLYASGYVEIEGKGLRPGQRVTNAGI